MRSKPRILSVSALLFAMAAACASPAPVDVPPAQVARDFYLWYVQSIARDREPLTDDRATVKKFVSPALIAEIDRITNSPDGLDADYFIQAQDFLDEWVADVAVSQVEIHGIAATLVVTLGEKSGKGYKLRVSLARIHGSWKVAKVQRLRN